MRGDEGRRDYDGPLRDRERRIAAGRGQVAVTEKVLPVVAAARSS